MLSASGRSGVALVVVSAWCGGGCSSPGAKPVDAATSPACTPGDVPQLIAELQGPDPLAADQAYQSLFCSRVDAIAALLALGDSTAIYAGSAYANPNSSLGPEASPALAQVALYLVDGIRLGTPAPYFSLRLSSIPLLDDRALLAAAVLRYRTWWNANRGRPISELAASNPLDAGGQPPAIFWAGVAPGATVQVDGYGCHTDPFGPEVPDSETPWKRFPGTNIKTINFCGAAHPFGCVHVPDIPGKTPFNCLAWALGYTDRWIDPQEGPPGTTASAIAHAYGYRTKLDSCSGSCAPYLGPMLQLIFTRGQWWHAMRKDDDGTWSSKNGECSRYTGITDGQADAFIRDYLVEPQTGPPLYTTQCYCKGKVGDDPPPPPPTLVAGTSTGDPHLTTCDGLHYNLQAVGELTLALDTTDGAEVQVRTAPWPGRNDVAMNVAVAARIGSHVVAVYADGTLRIDHAVSVLAGGAKIVLDSGTLYHAGTSYVVVWPDTTQLWIEPRGPALAVKLYASDQRKGRLSGLLGNFDGNVGNEFATRQGTALPQPVLAAALYNAYAESWRIAQASSLFDYDAGQTTESFTDRSFPHRLTVTRDLSDAARESATAACQAAAVPPAWIDDCILDVGLTGDTRFADAFAELPAPVAPADIDTTGGTVPAGTCVPTGSMMSPRLGFEARAVTLGNGKVLVAGGLDTSTGHVLAGAELYDPATGAFTSAGSMSRPRIRFALVALAGGKVLATGGVNDAGTLEATAELYDPDQNVWTPTASMATARVDFNAATLPDGGALVIAGAGGISGFNRSTGVVILATALTSAEIYDPGAGSFTATGSTIAAGTTMFAVTPRLDGAIFAVTGATGELYTAATTSTPGRFTSIGALPTAITGAGAFAFTLPSGDVFALPALALSDALSGSTVGAPVLVAPVSNRFTALANDTIGGTSAAIRLVTGDVFIVGGQHAGVATAATQVYRARSASWQLPGATTVVRHGPVLANLPDGGVLVMGGCQSNACGATVLASAEICNPAPAP